MNTLRPVTIFNRPLPKNKINKIHELPIGLFFLFYFIFLIISSRWDFVPRANHRTGFSEKYLFYSAFDVLFFFFFPFRK